MIKKMKDMRDADRQVVMCQIESVRDKLRKDVSKEATLSLLQATMGIVERHKAELGIFKNMSSLEKNRMALNLISSMRHKDGYY